MPANLVIVGVGVLPNKEIAPSLPPVRAAGWPSTNMGAPAQKTYSPAAMYVIPGDIAWAPRPEHWRAAQIQGAAVARATLGITPRPVEPNWFWSDQYSAHVEGVGLCDPHNGLSVFYLRNGAVSGAISINQPRDVRWAMRAIKSKEAVDRERLANPDVNIQSLAAHAR